MSIIEVFSMLCVRARASIAGYDRIREDAQ